MFGGVVLMDADDSPWQRCTACATCEWWNGYLCRQNGIGYRDCPAYGIDFVDTIIAVDCQGSPRLIDLAKGQTAEDVMAASSQDALTNPEAVIVGSAQGFLHLLTYDEEPFNENKTT